MRSFLLNHSDKDSNSELLLFCFWNNTMHELSGLNKSLIVFYLEVYLHFHLELNV
jgi:hypothetical protein